MPRIARIDTKAEARFVQISEIRGRESWADFCHIEHKERKDAANLRIFCRCFVFYAFLVVLCCDQLQACPPPSESSLAAGSPWREFSLPPATSFSSQENVPDPIRFDCCTKGVRCHVTPLFYFLFSIYYFLFSIFYFLSPLLPTFCSRPARAAPVVVGSSVGSIQPALFHGGCCYPPPPPR